MTVSWGGKDEEGEKVGHIFQAACQATVSHWTPPATFPAPPPHIQASGQITHPPFAHPMEQEGELLTVYLSR
jgi:hypothetical protein